MATEAAPAAAIEPNYDGAYRLRFISPSSERAARVLSKLKLLSLAAAVLLSFIAGAAAQNIELRQWRGSAAAVRQPEQVMATSISEWRSLWLRVGANPPDMFEPGRMNAIGIFLGQRPGPFSINVLSASRRRDRIMVVFEERGPTDMAIAEHPPASLQPAPRALSAGPGFGGGPAASFVAPGAAANLPSPSPPPAGRPPMGPPTSPWAIVLIGRTDLPITVEQRLYR